MQNIVRAKGILHHHFWGDYTFGQARPVVQPPAKRATARPMGSSSPLAWQRVKP